MRADDAVYFCAPARLIIEKGARARLPALVAHLGYRCGVLVTDTFFAAHTHAVVCANTSRPRQRSA